MDFLASNLLAQSILGNDDCYITVSVTSYDDLEYPLQKKTTFTYIGAYAGYLTLYTTLTETKTHVYA